MTHKYAEPPLTDTQLLETLLRFEGRAFSLVLNDDGTAVIGVAEAERTREPPSRRPGRHPEPHPFRDALLLQLYDDLEASGSFKFKETGLTNKAAIFTEMARREEVDLSSSQIKKRLAPFFQARGTALGRPTRSSETSPADL